jgi:HSP20 family protein
MTLIKSPFSTMPKLMSDFFDMDRYFGNDLLERDFMKSMPSVNVVEKDNEYSIELAAPGMEKKDFHINVNNNVLTISAEREEEKKEENKKYTRREFSYGSFERSFTLPEGVMGDKIEAKYDSGILRISIPKNEEVTKQNKAREISIS